MPGKIRPACVWLLIVLCALVLACTSTSPTCELDCEGYPARALCIPEPEPGAELRGQPTDEWSPACGELIAVPCERGVTCRGDGCSCVCDHEGDCREAALGMAALGGPPGRSSVCVDDRCVWGLI